MVKKRLSGWQKADDCYITLKIPEVNQENLLGAYGTEVFWPEVMRVRCEWQWLLLGISIGEFHGLRLGIYELSGEEDINSWLETILKLVILMNL